MGLTGLIQIAAHKGEGHLVFDRCFLLPGLGHGVPDRAKGFGTAGPDIHQKVIFEFAIFRKCTISHLFIENRLDVARKARNGFWGLAAGPDCKRFRRVLGWILFTTNHQIIPAYGPTKLGESEARDFHVRFDLELAQIKVQIGPLTGLWQVAGRKSFRGRQSAVRDGVCIAPDGPIGPRSVDVELNHHGFRRILWVEPNSDAEITLTREVHRLLEFRDNILSQASVCPLDKGFARRGFAFDDPSRRAAVVGRHFGASGCRIVEQDCVDFDYGQGRAECGWIGIDDGQELLAKLLFRLRDGLVQSLDLLLLSCSG